MVFANVEQLIVLCAPVCMIADFLLIGTLILVSNVANDGGVIRVRHFKVFLMYGSSIMGVQCKQ